METKYGSSSKRCPAACFGVVPFGYVNVFTGHMNAGFFQGEGLPDPARLSKGTAKFMRHVKVRPGTPIDAGPLRRLIEVAYADIRPCVENG